MNPALSYIIDFLLGDKKNTHLNYRIGYTSDVWAFDRYNLVIVPSPFFDEQVFGTPASMPELPLKEVEGVPLLFGTPETAWVGGTFVVHADIIAGAFFLLTRYEEIRRREVRDAYGRFPGKESLPYRAGFIRRPLVDEYGKLLRGWLRVAGLPVAEPEARIRKIWLTHDVDAPFYCRSLRNVVRETFKGGGFKEAVEMVKQPVMSDPYFTFPWLTTKDKHVIEALGKKRCAVLYLLKAGGRSAQDKPHYHLHSPDGQVLLAVLRANDVIFGLHSSYDAAKKPSLIADERHLLERILGQKIRHNRHHYLACREPEDFVLLEKAGITDDFTMGYADVAGFRLGTARPVRWINPSNKHLSSLTLHPLTIMDVTLSEAKYMHLDYDSAYAYCLDLINQVEQAAGELVLLWHNDSVTLLPPRDGAVDWHGRLYKALTDELKSR